MTVSQKYGVPAEVTASNAATLEKATFHVRTELGISPSGYHHNQVFPVYGTGQGSANSPAIWCFLSSTLFDCYDTRAHQATYWDTQGDIRVQLGLIGFVDDCNGQTTSFGSDGSSTTVTQLASQAQDNAQCWSDLLYASGGSLELSKCLAHILQWTFSMAGAPVLVPAHSPSDVSINVWDRQSNDTKRYNYSLRIRHTRLLGTIKIQRGLKRNNIDSCRRRVILLQTFFGKYLSHARKRGRSISPATYQPSVTRWQACLLRNTILTECSGRLCLSSSPDAVFTVTQ
jgi:hypothetical protein